MDLYYFYDIRGFSKINKNIYPSSTKKHTPLKTTLLVPSNKFCNKALRAQGTNISCFCDKNIWFSYFSKAPFRKALTIPHLSSDLQNY